MPLSPVIRITGLFPGSAARLRVLRLLLLSLLIGALSPVVSASLALDRAGPGQDICSATPWWSSLGDRADGADAPLTAAGEHGHSHCLFCRLPVDAVAGFPPLGGWVVADGAARSPVPFTSEPVRPRLDVWPASLSRAPPRRV